MSLYNELKRRNVFRVAIAYLAGAWLLTEVAGTLFPAFGVPDWGVRFVVIVLALGFLPALIISWAYELTPEGLKREKDVVREASITHFTAKRLDGITIGLIMAALVFIVVDRFWLSPRHAEQLATPAEVVTDNAQASESESTEPQYPPKSIAVLPFVNMSDDAANEYFSDGISEELLNLLAKIPELRVISRSSAFTFKGEKVDIPTVAKKLNVAHVLEGSVRKVGNRVRITAQLIDTRSDTHLWSETYDRSLEDIFAIQDEISGQIVGALKIVLETSEQLTLSQAQKPVINMEAYDLYLRGRSSLAKRSHKNIQEAIGYFEQALLLEPEYSPAMASLSRAWGVWTLYTTEVAPLVAFDHSANWAEKALKIDPDSSEALTMLAYAKFIRDLELNSAFELMKRALEISPGDAEVHNFYGDLLTRVGDFDTALFHESKAFEIDPLTPIQASDLCSLYTLIGEYDKALEYCFKALEINPILFYPNRELTQIYFARGNIKALKESYKKLESLSGIAERYLLWPQAQLLIAEGKLEQVDNLLDMALTSYRAGEISLDVPVSIALLLGQFDTAGEILLEADNKKVGHWLYPRFVRLPEQAPDSEPWQLFWQQHGVDGVAEIRRRNGLDPHFPSYGEAAMNAEEH